jgi:HAD superfamily hydrolase (TIGR01509 family)
MTDADDLAGVLARTRCLLLDFDGPMCSVFAGRLAAGVADRLRRLVRSAGYPLSVAVVAAEDPFDVLRYAGDLDPALAERVDAAFRAEELAAVESAEPTPGAAAVLAAARASGRPVAVVSNNSQVAVSRYLARLRLGGLVATVAGRTCADAGLLKPDPHLVLAALDTLGAPPTATAFVGDSVSDIEAGLAVGVSPIGYANKPGKAGRLAAAGASCVVDSMHLVADQLTRVTACG